MADETNGTKPGYRTTEFYLSALTVLGGLAMSSGLLHGQDAENVKTGINVLPQIAGLVSTLVGALSYLWSRTKIKTANGNGATPK